MGIRSLVIIGSNPATVSFFNDFNKNTKTEVIGLIQQFEGTIYDIEKLENKKKCLPVKGKEEDILGDDWNRVYLDTNIPNIICKKGRIIKTKNWILDLNPDVIISHGPEKLPTEIINCAKFGGLNIHWGLSPYYRGMYTVRWPILEGSLEYVGLTIHKLDANLDTGPIIYQGRPELREGLCYKEIEYMLTNIAKNKIEKCIQYIVKNSNFSEQNLKTGKHFWARDWNQSNLEKIENKDYIDGQIRKYNANKAELDKTVDIVNLIE